MRMWLERLLLLNGGLPAESSYISLCLRCVSQWLLFISALFLIHTGPGVRPPPAQCVEESVHKLGTPLARETSKVIWCYAHNCNATVQTIKPACSVLVIQCRCWISVSTYTFTCIHVGCIFVEEGKIKKPLNTTEWIFWDSHGWHGHR